MAANKILVNFDRGSVAAPPKKPKPSNPNIPLMTPLTTLKELISIWNILVFLLIRYLYYSLFTDPYKNLFAAMLPRG